MTTTEMQVSSGSGVVFTVIRDAERRSTEYCLRIPDSAFEICEVDRIDRALLAECGSSEKLSDKMLGLEVMVRRIEEANAKQKQPA